MTVIISVNPNPSLSEFQSLMRNTDILLNEDALARPEYYSTRGGNPLEDDVKNALDESARGTPFAGTIEKVSGQKFPDIVAAKLYGVEVKSTKSNHWVSTGSSILETTRVTGVERIYMTFGKLGGNPIEFISKPYEECLYGIAVTHMPRYLINMQLSPGESIFDKIGISYDDLRQMEDPIEPVAQYYRSQLGPGERLWWTGKDSESAAPPTVRLWSSLPKDEKDSLLAQGCVVFPEILMNCSPKKYNRYALWLVTEKGVVNTNVRDGFSAGGKVIMKTAGGVEISMPATFGRIRKYSELITAMLYEVDESVLSESWNEAVEEDRLRQWCHLVARAAETYPDVGYKVAWNVLKAIFPNIESKRSSSTPKDQNRPYPTSSERFNPYDMVAERNEATEYAGVKFDSKKSLCFNIDVSVGDKVENTVCNQKGTVIGFKRNYIVVDFGKRKSVYEFPNCFIGGGSLRKL